MDKIDTKKSNLSLSTPKKSFLKNQQRLEMIISAYAPHSTRLPPIAKSERYLEPKTGAKLAIKKPNIVKLVKEEPLPPWMQDIGIRSFNDDKVSLIQYDLLSQKDKLILKNRCMPDRIKSKVKTVFRAQEKVEKDKKLKNVFRRIRKMDTHKFEKEMMKLKWINSDPEFQKNEEDDIKLENIFSQREIGINIAEKADLNASEENSLHRKNNNHKEDIHSLPNTSPGQ
ncbi:unnamed protein product [Blepharisma stoltei]|uniref:Uncharacterized protein n=1 Tax=Blepharisma stoltei TaxID=1481888 RepID=A0AAU9JFF0_9CILI|nr:unnamed protein product [Blepharisma stoltei]